MNQNTLKQFITHYLSQEVLPANAKCVMDDKITLDLKLVDKGIVIGWQDKRIPTNNENNLVMRYAELRFNTVKSKPKKKSTIGMLDDFIDNFKGNLLQSKAVAKTEKLPAKSIRKINVKGTAIEILHVMNDVYMDAVQIYWINSGLKQSEEKRRLRNERNTS